MIGAEWALQRRVWRRDRPGKWWLSLVKSDWISVDGDMLILPRASRCIRLSPRPSVWPWQSEKNQQLRKSLLHRESMYPTSCKLWTREVLIIERLPHWQLFEQYLSFPYFDLNSSFISVPADMSWLSFVRVAEDNVLGYAYALQVGFLLYSGLICMDWKRWLECRAWCLDIQLTWLLPEARWLVGGLPPSL
jgi:hypothetical protein